TGLEKSFEGGIISDGRIICFGNVPAYRIAGIRNTDPDAVSIIYSLLHYGTFVQCTYCFDRSLDFDGELVSADSIIESIELYGPDGFPEDKRPEDCAMESPESVNISAARVEIPVPGSGQKVQWSEKTGNRYNFDVDLNGYRLECDIVPVWTSGNSALQEWMAEFERNEGKNFDGGFVGAPKIRKLNSTSAIRAAGKSGDYPDRILVKYFMLHNGARLLLTGYVPSNLDLKSEMGRIDSFVNGIVFY
ncbi:MAG: hypothetical protein ACI395_08590, partial [Candidatus Cryptobacteroides sp.]